MQLQLRIEINFFWQKIYIFLGLILISLLFPRYDLQDSAWIYKHSQESLHELLNKEIGENILGLQDAGFEDLYCGRRRTPSEK